MDRCALFVAAGYVLADGAMADHGSRPQEVAWDYAGLLTFLTSLARDRTGLPVLRCYWYETAADSRGATEHEALASIPGVKLRLPPAQPGRREGAEADMRRDLITLARNRAVSDAVIVGAQEELGPVIADVQDLGVRVLLVHIPADGGGTAPRSLRQECDDVIETPAASLRPFAHLMAAAGPDRRSESHPGMSYSSGELSPAAAQRPGAAEHDGLAHPAAGQYQPPGQSLGSAASQQAGLLPAREHVRASPSGAAGQPAGTGGAAGRDLGVPVQRHGHRERDREAAIQADPAVTRPPDSGSHGLRQPAGAASGPAVPDADTDAMNRQRPYPVPDERTGPAGGGRGGLPLADAGQGGPARSLPKGGVPRNDVPQHGLPQRGLPSEPAEDGLPQHGASQDALPQNGLPQSRLPQNGRPQNGLPQHGLPQHGLPQNGHVAERAPRPDEAPRGRQGRPPGSGAPYLPAGPYSGTAPAAYDPLTAPRSPQYGAPYSDRIPGSSAQVPYGSQPSQGSPPSGPPAHEQLSHGPLTGPQPPVSLTDAVQAAHAEGAGFGRSVARDAPALWLEAVLARKPRMPSDLEARLLQGSALPVDSLRHDDIRHALQQGFWDALERSRR